MSRFDIKTKTSDSNLTMVQMEKLYERVAQLAIEYDISITKENIYTHMEYDSSERGAHHGKIDIIYIPFINLLGMDKCGDYIRTKIKWYYDKLNKKKGSK